MPPRKRAYRNLGSVRTTRTATLWTTTISGTTTLWTTTTSRLVSKTRNSTLKTIYLIQSNEKNEKKREKKHRNHNRIREKNTETTTAAC